MQGRRPSISDVAIAAGVSAATVSRALRGSPEVKPATRERIEAVARELRYRVDPAASRLARGRGSTVTMVVAMLDGWYFPSVMAGAEAVLAANGYELAVTVMGGDAPRKPLMSNSLLLGADGVILVNVALDRGEIAALADIRCPTVTVGLEFEGMSCVAVDDVTVGRRATAHLLDLGHTAIALVGGASENPLGFVVPSARREGYLAAHGEASVAVRPELEVDGGFTLGGGYDAMLRLLDRGDRPTAVFAMSDEMAFGVIKAAREHGLRVPEDLSIVGVDDHPLSWVEDLTTVHQRVSQHGAVAAQMVLDHISGERAPARQELQVELIERATTAPTPGA